MTHDMISPCQAPASRLRRHALERWVAAGSSHSSSSLSAADTITCLHFAVIRHRPEGLFWEECDRFRLSTGHACPVLYATLAEAGYSITDLLTALRRFRGLAAQTALRRQETCKPRATFVDHVCRPLEATLSTEEDGVWERL